MILALFSALGAYVQYEQSNWALMVMYVVLGPLVLAVGLRILRNAFPPRE